MAVCWRCPDCGEVSCEADSGAMADPVECDHCGSSYLRHDTLCTVCESPNPWARRDTLHFICRICGNSQTLYSHTAAARFLASGA